MPRRIIICGPAASGKDYLRQKLEYRGFKSDISYTTRPMRAGEIDGKTYHYISEKDFSENVGVDWFYEWAKHGDYYYGTGQWEWDHCDVFIMETHGISQISKEDRKHCFIIYLNPPKVIREERLRRERMWSEDNIGHRTTMDSEKFKDFKDYDIEITDPYF